MFDYHLRIRRSYSDAWIGAGQQRTMETARSEELHARLVVRAEKEGVSLNTLVATLIAEGIGRRDAVKRH